jgi:hypothetical protein
MLELHPASTVLRQAFACECVDLASRWLYVTSGSLLSSAGSSCVILLSFFGAYSAIAPLQQFYSLQNISELARNNADRVVCSVCWHHAALLLLVLL